MLRNPLVGDAVGDDDDGVTAGADEISRITIARLQNDARTCDGSEECEECDERNV